MLFTIKAFHQNAGVVALSIEAESAEEATRKVETDGYRIVSITTSSFKTGFTTQRFPLTLFTEELLSLLEAGLPLLESLEALAKKSKQVSTDSVFQDMVRLLREGKSLSIALESFPAIFPPLYVALVRASERTGDLPKALRRYLTYRADMDVIRGKITSAAIYPVLLLSVASLVILFLLTYVVPRFSHVFEDISGDLPFMSRLLMQWGQFLDANSGSFLLTVASGVVLLGYWLMQRQTRVWLTGQLLELPLIGERAKTYELSRFYRTLGMLLEGGIPILKALEMTAGLLAQPSLKVGLLSATREISEGKAVSSAMRSHDLTTEVGYQMLAVGERSGNLGEMMERISHFHDAEIARWMNWFTRLFEPILMLFIGLAIGGIVLLMYMPIFELAGSLQ